jgi:hypothetical protein
VNKLRVAVAMLIAIIWATGYLLAFFDRSFQPDPEVSGIMIAMITWLFGSELKNRWQKEKSESDKQGD